MMEVSTRTCVAHSNMNRADVRLLQSFDADHNDVCSFVLNRTRTCCDTCS